ncbi:MAG TPA: hypothetical protein VGS96_13350 [Thermoanaerobaculia bacterium]|nr:hypothetical protein [Thermoanaerobaculia bacterium]
MLRARILLLFCVLLPSAGFAQTEAINLTALFRAGGIEIDRLLVYKISDIVLIRGRTLRSRHGRSGGAFREESRI